MSWISPWTTSVPTILVICAVLTWWFTEPKTTHLNLIVTIGCILFFWTVAPELPQDSPTRLWRLCITTAKFLRLDSLVIYHANMLVTGAAVLWLVHRAWQTLWKPVPELINVLGVDVPDPPDVSLAGIRSDAATLNWTRPRTNRPVNKFLIQVNGVNVGESAHQETAITVTGLKPNHFYNIRVIAVGHNNFQSGSRVIRLRTFARDGRPELGNGRLPSNFVPEEQHASFVKAGDGSDENGLSKGPASIETVSISDSSTAPTRERDSSLSVPAPRRNTISRKHSPSTTSMESSVKEIVANLPEESLQKLGERFENIRKETEEIQAQIAKDEKEHKELVDHLAEEKESKRRLLKEKDDLTERLKREMGSTDRSMRSAQQRKAQLEKQLEKKHNERNRLHDEMARWEKDMVQMRKRQDDFEKDRSSIKGEGDEQASELRADILALQESLAREEAELKEKGKELKDAEDQRKKLPGGEESEEWREKSRQIQREWDMKARELHRRLWYANKRAKALDEYENVLRSQLAAAQQSSLAFSYDQANSSGIDFDLSNQNAIKRRSRHSNSLSIPILPSPVNSYATAELPFASSNSLGSSHPTFPPGFGPAPLMPFSGDISAPLDEEGFKALTADAPLSPTATSLLPAGMLDNDDDEDPLEPVTRLSRHNTFSSAMSPKNEPLSPESERRSPSIFSSPHESTPNLPFSQYTGDHSDRLSLRGDLVAASSPVAAPAQANKFATLLPWLHRGPKVSDEPPALGTLKPSHSQSFPRQTADLDVSPNKRRISFSAGWSMFKPNSANPNIPEDRPAGSASSMVTRRLGHHLFSTSAGAGSSFFPERNPSSPRPGSIASAELPRPSTDSGSIWGNHTPANRLWVPDSADPWSSRNASRRPSIHGSPSALKTTLADADDEILDDSEIRPPASVGVIGSKPVKSFAQRLNPNAPSFMTTLFRPMDKEAKEHKDKDKEKDKSKGKAKEKDAAKDKKPRESFTSASESNGRPSLEESPCDSRKSRDGYSVETPSISESHESLSLDPAVSNTSEAIVGSIKDHESGFKRLLRKGSSSKFSFSSMRTSAGKKGPNSVNNSDKSFDRSSFDLDERGEDDMAGTIGRSYDSLTSSPSLGPMKAKEKAGGGPMSWANRFGMKKKPGKEKESFELDREDMAE